ncbi:sensor domain-containing protein [Mycolicibacterium sp. S2-37]|uniref:sensor histidine kinase n=1 Tax=Mycolicibacterium sp. S2-37 TaxID=2810297 RepID=UPI001A940FF8|nr:sensor domain-containing protein [Mycolicibacterium sp. S2-37]MBO0678433.1 sensor domain-containing protein [Mycolicibacterium sp. S2-37]
MTPTPTATAASWTRTALTPLRRPAWRAYAYVILVSVLAVVAVVYLFVTGLASGLLIVTVIGIPLLALVVLSGRAWNGLYRSLAGFTGVAIDAPPPFVRPAGGRLHTIAAALSDAVGWRSLAFLMVHAVVMTPVGYLVIVGVVTCGVLVVSPVVWLAMREPLVSFGEPVESLWQYTLLAVAGAAGLYLLGWLMLGLCRAHLWLAVTMLGPTGRERRVGQLEQARADVVDESAATLRRVERDLHDGTQARLITVAMALARADEHLASSDVPGARTLVSDALAGTKDTLTELRDLVRGIRPPALDLGLGPAVQTLAARHPIPVDVSVDLAVRPSIGVETMAYFCVAELLANVSKHSEAGRASVRIHSDPADLRIVVEDDGTGGIEVANGSGLTGLRDRLAMLDGRLEIDSPAGGPTTVTVVVPPGAEQ